MKPINVIPIYAHEDKIMDTKEEKGKPIILKTRADFINFINNYCAEWFEVAEEGK